MRRDEEHILRKVLRKDKTDIPGKGREDDRNQDGKPPTKLDRHWADSGRGDGQVDVEKEGPT